ncbi:hypothetical protein BH11MYX2_BH11MYX2_38310 [soil metagenome]
MRTLAIVILLAGPAAAKPCDSLAKQVDANATRAVCTRVKSKLSLQLVTYQVPDPNGSENGIVHPAALFSGDVMVWQGDGGANVTLEHLKTYSTADLDRDGRDELLVTKLRLGHENFDHSWLEVHRIHDDGTPEEQEAMVAELGSSSKYPEAACIATYKIVDGGIVVSRKRTGEAGAQHCVPLSRYEFRATPKK